MKINKNKEEWSDSERLDWLEKNYINGLDVPRFGFNPPKPTWHKELKEEYPNGFWAKHLGSKDRSNRWATLREAIDAAMYNTL